MLFGLKLDGIIHFLLLMIKLLSECIDLALHLSAQPNLRFLRLFDKLIKLLDLLLLFFHTLNHLVFTVLNFLR